MDKNGTRRILTRIGNEKGIVLVVVLLLIAVLALLGSTAVMTTTTDIKISSNYMQGEQAFYNADAGADLALRTIGSGTAGIPPWPVAGGTPTVVTLTVPSGFNFDSSVTVSAVTGMINTFKFSVHGVSGASDREIDVYFKRKSAIGFGAFADGSVDLKAASGIYSYDSRVTPNPNPADYPANSTGNGDVGSNTEVRTYNGTYVGGDVGLGASTTGTDASLVSIGTPIITGTQGELVGRVDPDPLGALTAGGDLYTDFSTYSTANDNAVYGAGFTGTTINASGTVTLTGKAGGSNFYFTSIILKNGATLNINATAGPVNIYLAGNLEAKNGSNINVTGLPTSFSIFGSSVSSSIIFKHGSEFRGTVYAPNAAIEMKNSADTYGMIWGKTIDMKNSGQFFFDEAIKDKFLGNGVKPVAWRDVMQ
ncbi:MAG: PilX N-terminal domain-containing pilus assembly protein [Syntrophales bacterium]|nr:PilX N-terminal domain-containing pilus assembly protein [Syntrophales bacterium]